jgi:hypothetical protein
LFFIFFFNLLSHFNFLLIFFWNQNFNFTIKWAGLFRLWIIVSIPSFPLSWLFDFYKLLFFKLKRFWFFVVKKIIVLIQNILNIRPYNFKLRTLSFCSHFSFFHVLLHLLLKNIPFLNFSITFLLNLSLFSILFLSPLIPSFSILICFFIHIFQNL